MIRKGFAIYVQAYQNMEWDVKQAISRNKNRDLWKEVKAMTHARQELPSVIDGQIGDENIAKIFHEK